jgi:hypothetical protein
MELGITVADASGADAVWQLLLSQQHGEDDRPAIDAVVVENSNGPQRWRLAYNPQGHSWEVQHLAPVASDLASQLNDALSLDHHLHLAEWFALQGELCEVVRDGLDRFAMALEQAETARLLLQRMIRAAEQQQCAA